MRETKLAALFAVTAIGALACNSEGPKEDASTEWTCESLSIPNGSTSFCRSGTPSKRVAQAPSNGGSIGVRTYDVPSGSPDSNDDSDDSSTPTPPSSDADEDYECSAGSEKCPPKSDTTGSSNAGGDTYKCSRQGGATDCTEKTPTCNAGSVPEDDRCVPTDGSTTTPPTVTSNCYEVGLASEVPNADGSTTWTYRVRELACAQDLSNWVLGTGNCTIVSGSPKYEEVNPDPNAQLVGVKWETGGGFSDGLFSITTTGGTRGTIKFATKGPKVAYGTVEGPVCK